MIPRILVPTQLHPAPAESGPPRRTSSFLDDRLVVPADLPVVPLDGKSNIPAHVPLDVLGNRVVVPRDMPSTPLEVRDEMPTHAPLTELDERFAVPHNARPKSLQMERRVPIERLEGVVEPDVLTTGQVNLLISPEEQQKKNPFRGLMRWLPQSGTALLHAAILMLAVFQPHLFPYRAPSESEIALASRSLGKVYLPPSPPGTPGPPTVRPSPQIEVDPRVLRRILPSEPTPVPMPAPSQPEPSPRVLPEQPRPQPADGNEPRASASPPTLQLETPKAPQPNPSLQIPRMSAGRAIEESARTSRGGGSTRGTFSDRIPNRSGGGGGAGGFGGGGGGDATVGGGIEMLTPTEGVDFSNYLQQVLTRVRINWYAVIPQSAQLGEKGRVVLEFRILRNGVVPLPEPDLIRSSGREPLDRAAISSIRASSAFAPLPPEFSGEFIKLRFIFLYNLPLDSP